MEKKKGLPIKDEYVLKQVEDTLLNHFQYGVRSYMIFQVGEVILLWISDVLILRYYDVFDEQGSDFNDNVSYRSDIESSIQGCKRS